MDPPVSEPIAPQQSSAATATPDPVDGRPALKWQIGRLMIDSNGADRSRSTGSTGLALHMSTKYPQL
jgi:hypothetical protein